MNHVSSSEFAFDYVLARCWHFKEHQKLYANFFVAGNHAGKDNKRRPVACKDEQDLFVCSLIPLA